MGLRGSEIAASGGGGRKRAPTLSVSGFLWEPSLWLPAPSTFSNMVGETVVRSSGIIDPASTPTLTNFLIESTDRFSESFQRIPEVSSGKRVKSAEGVGAAVWAFLWLAHALSP